MAQQGSASVLPKVRPHFVQPEALLFFLLLSLRHLA